MRKVLVLIGFAMALGLVGCGKKEQQELTHPSNEDRAKFLFEPMTPKSQAEAAAFMAECRFQGVSHFDSRLKEGMKFVEIGKDFHLGKQVALHETLHEIKTAQDGSFFLRSSLQMLQSSFAEVKFGELVVDSSDCRYSEMEIFDVNQRLDCKKAEIVKGTYPEFKSEKTLYGSERSVVERKETLEIDTGNYQLPNGKVIFGTRITEGLNVEYGRELVDKDEMNVDVARVPARKTIVRIISNEIPLTNAVVCGQALISEDISYTALETGDEISRDITLNYPL